MAYQDAWIRGEIHQRGDRSCAERYAFVRDVVRTFTRQVTAWDLGANLGYFGCRLADEFGVVSVMVESRPALVAICESNAIPTTIAMTHRLSLADLNELATCEHADVVLALNVLHHFDDWQRAVSNVLRMGEHVIIETPGRGDVGSANYPQTEHLLDAIESLHPDVLGYTDSHVTPGVKRPVFLFRHAKPSLSRGYCYIERVRARGAHAPRAHRIVSTPTEKRITYADGEAREFVAGMNLWNWLQLGGSYPSRSAVKRAVTNAAQSQETPHGDVKPWNVVLQGDRAALIDGGHRRSSDDAIGLSDTLRWIDQPEAAYVRKVA